jgi:hypothetical protein
MFILRDLLHPLQAQFSTTAQGQKRKLWFAYTLLAVVVPFTSSITSNLLRTLHTLFGLTLQSQRFYSFMASSTLPWKRLWRTMWHMIPAPATDGRIIVALDDSINPKCGRNIFGCAHFHDHAAQINQSSYPWSQCIVAIGLLKQIHSRWAWLPLDFRFYLKRKDIELRSAPVTRPGKAVRFASKMSQAAAMIAAIRDHFQQPVVVVTDSWFGNDGLWSRIDGGGNGGIHLLSRMRSNNTLYDFPPAPPVRRRAGRPRKYGTCFGSVGDCAARWKDKARTYGVFLYGKNREVQAYSQAVMVKTMKCPVRVVWVYRKTRYVALMTTDMTLSVEQISITGHAGRLKQDSRRSSRRSAVLNLKCEMLIQ